MQNGNTWRFFSYLLWAVRFFQTCCFNRFMKCCILGCGHYFGITHLEKISRENQVWLKYWYFANLPTYVKIRSASKSNKSVMMHCLKLCTWDGFCSCNCTSLGTMKIIVIKITIIIIGSRWSLMQFTVKYKVISNYLPKELRSLSPKLRSILKQCVL